VSLLPVDPAEFLVALGVVVLGSAVQATVGFGLALIAAPVLMLIHPAFVPGPLMAAALVLVLLMAYRDHDAIDFAGLGYAMAGRVVGTLAAGLFLAVASIATFNLVFGGLVLAAALISAFGFRVTPGPRNTTIAGALSGLMGTISSIGGPPMALLYQGAGTTRLRGTLAGFFIAGGAFTLGVLAAVGRFGWEELRLAGLLAPATLVGFLLALPLRRRVSEGAARPVIIVLSAACGIAVLWRTVA